jgi:hypothetical protein
MSNLKMKIIQLRLSKIHIKINLNIHFQVKKFYYSKCLIINKELF